MFPSISLVSFLSLICPLAYRAHSFPCYPHFTFLTLLLPWPIWLLLPSNFISPILVIHISQCYPDVTLNPTCPPLSRAFLLIPFSFSFSSSSLCTVQTYLLLPHPILSLTLTARFCIFLIFHFSFFIFRYFPLLVWEPSPIPRVLPSKIILPP